MHIVLFVLSQICAEKTARNFAKICSSISTCGKVSGVSIFHFLPVLLGLFVTHVGRRDVEMLKKACHDVEMLCFQKSRSGILGMTQHVQRTGTIIFEVQLFPRKLRCPLKINGWKVHFLLK